MFIILLGASVLLWQVIYSPSGVAKKVTLEIPSDSTAVVKIEGGSSFVEIPGVGTLIESESVRATRGSGTALTFFDGSRVSLDQNTEVTLTRVREHDSDESVDILLDINSGQVWASITKKINPKSLVTLRKGAVAVETSGGEISFGENTIRVLAGKAQVLIQDERYTILEIGQEITLTDEDISAIIAGGAGPEKALITADFQDSDWFTSHMNRDVNTEALPSESVTGEVLETDEASETPAPDIVILTPGKNDSVVTTADATLTISGTVPATTTKVLINDYALTRFVPGSTEFSYNAAVEWGTLVEGENKYTIVAFGENDKRSEAQITIMYDPDAIISSISPAPTPSSDDEIDSSPSPSSTALASPTNSPSISSGGLTIDTPADGAMIDDAMIIVSGKAPSETARLVVDDYTLTAFTAGDTTWQYRMSDTFNNRPVGEITIKAIAYDSAGKIIESTQVTFTIEKAKEVSPTPTPTAGSASATSTASPKSTPSNSKYMPELRDDYLPPLPQDEQGGSTM